MNRSMVYNMGAYLREAPGIPNTAVTAAGAGDATEVDGPSLNRFTHKSRLARAAKAVIQVRGTLASGNTMTIAANFQHSTNDSDWTDLETALAATTVLDAAGGALADSYATTNLDVDLGGAYQYIRLQLTPDMSATGTDTSEVSAIIVCGGYEEMPSTDEYTLPDDPG